MSVVLALSPFGAQAQETQFWSLSASLSASRATNIFLTPVDGFGDTIGGGTLTLSYSRTRRAYDFGVTGWLFGAALSNFSILSGASGGLVLNGRFSASPVSRFRLHQSLIKGFDPRRLYGRGVALPQLDAASSSTSLGWGYEPSPTTTLNVSGDMTYVRYESQFLVSTPQLVSDTFPEQATPPTPEGVEDPPFFEQPDPSLFALSQLASEGVLSNSAELLTVNVGPSLTHQFSDRSSGNIGAFYRWSRWDGLETLGTPFSVRTGLFEAQVSFKRQLTPNLDLSPRYTFQKGTSFPRLSTHNVSGQLTHAFTLRFNADVFLGYSHSSDEFGFSAGTWTGGGGFSWRFDRGMLAASLSRTVYQPLGFGRVIANNLGFVSASYLPAEKVLIGGYGGMSTSRDQLDSGFDYENQFAGAFASYRISRRFSLTGSYSFRRYEFGLLPSAKTSIFGVSIAYVRIWK